MDELNKRVIQILSHSSLTKAELAAKLGVSPAQLSHIASGRNKPGVEILQKLLSMFPGLNALWLLSGEGAVFLKNEELSKWKLMAKKLNLKIQHLEIELTELKAELAEFLKD